MLSLEEIENKKEVVSSLKGIAYVYQQQALDKMDALREEVLATRRFLGGVADIYSHAKSAYLSSLGGGEKEFKRASFIQRNGRQVVVFLSANERFYGAIILDLWQEVREWVEEHDCDLVVVGDIGKHLAQTDDIAESVNYFEMDDENPTPEQISAVLDFISAYEQILVYHGAFKTVFSQSTQKEDISGSVTLKEAFEAGAEKYLFEPSPEDILRFFETEIIQALFKQTVLEHQLSRSASRLMAMSQAHERSEDKLTALKDKEEKLEKREENKKQLGAVARAQLMPDSNFKY